ALSLLSSFPSPCSRTRSGSLIDLRLLHGCLHYRDLVILKWTHPVFPLQCRFDIGREFRLLLRLPFGRFRLELRHDFLCKKLKRLANMLMLVAPGLLHEDYLIDTSIPEGLEMRAHVIRRADARSDGVCPLCRVDHFLRAVAARLDVVAPDVRAAWHCVMRNKRIQRIAEKLKAFMTTTNGFFAVMMQREV